MDDLSLAIEGALQADDFTEGLVMYDTASRLLRRELVRATGFLYLAVPAKYKG